MFIQNKYTKWYNNIIKNRKQNTAFGYTERHHIIPKSLGGNNKKENIVKLTAKEHFICHLLLVKMTENKEKAKMSYALRCLVNQQNHLQQRYKITSRMYIVIKSLTREAIGNIMKGKDNPFYGKSHSVETKQRMKEKRALQDAPMLGKNHSTETKQKLKDANFKQFQDPEQRALRSKKSKELWADPVWRAKWQESRRKKLLLRKGA
jgi:hypothetical protein